MSNEKPVELTEEETRIALILFDCGAASSLAEAEDDVREVVAAREALLEAAEESEMRINLANRVTSLEAKAARVEALAEELEADAERHRNAETLTAEDGARAYRAAVESAASAAAIRAALAEPERDEEGGR